MEVKEVLADLIKELNLNKIHVLDSKRKLLMSFPEKAYREGNNFEGETVSIEKEGIIKGYIRVEGKKLKAEERAKIEAVGKVIFILMERRIRRAGKKFFDFAGRSQAADHIRKEIRRAAATDYPVFIEGETGVGKTLVAEIIHRLSGRKGEFVVLHCGTIPKEIMESELFGYRKGAFTDAKENKEGLVDAAKGGTLFLDDVVEMTSNLQGKLLRFVETGRYRRLGESKERFADVRIISSSNVGVEEALSSGRLRKDLFYRLSTIRIKIPPLRQRRDDIEELIKYHSSLLNGRELSREAVDYIKNHPLPGNCRQLINVLVSLGLSREDKKVITLSEVEKLLPMEEVSGAQEVSDELWRRIQRGSNFWEAVWKPFIERDLNRRQVREFLDKVRELANDNWKKVCEILRIKEDYFKFMSLLRKYRLK